MNVPADKVDTFPPPGTSYDAVTSRGGRFSVGRAVRLFGLSLAGLVLTGFPVWAARRILYPLRLRSLPEALGEELDIEEGALPEKVEFASLDGHQLGGWFVPGPDPNAAPWPVVLLVHGYGSYKEEMAVYARILRAGGFATLMFDMEGSGLRHGRAVTLGFKERWSVMGAARYLRTRPDVDPERIGALGVSMGAATAIMAAAEDPTIKAVVSDSGYADINSMVKPGLKAFLGLPSYLFAPLIVRYAEMMIGARATDIVPERAAAHLGDRPMLVIHGADDTLVSPESAHRLYRAASGPKELWIVPDCQHGQAPEVAPEEYMERVNGFFARWLVGAGEAVVRASA